MYTAAHAQAWQTMGWDNFPHLRNARAAFPRTLQQGATPPLDLLVDELKTRTASLGRTGYLRALPVTVFELLPVNEFSSRESWGYDPAFYFAIDDFYGGAPAMARDSLNAAHAAVAGA